jgi:hypothetical protein
MVEIPETLTTPFARKLSLLFHLSVPVRPIKIFFWLCAIGIGLAQTWTVRHIMFSDGLSYVQIAAAYRNGDWANAINPYWSPLYSWVLAIAYSVLRPAPYWQIATLHLVNFLAFLASFAAFEFFMAELIRWKRMNAFGSTSFSDSSLYFAGYTVLLFEGLAQVGTAATSPDMTAMVLTIVLATLLLRVCSRDASSAVYILIGVVCAALFLARTAFAPCFVVVLATVGVSLFRSRRRWLTPVILVTATAVCLSAPFVYAISKQMGRFTIGESGRLNYAWEVNSAPRFRHWQGEPKELGIPKHPTTLAVRYPAAFTFAGPVGGSYPPWYNPAYWYDGIHPRFELHPQIQVLLVNLSVLCLIIGRSPIVVPVLLLIPFCGVLLWWRRFLRLWPVILLPLSSLALYSLVYIERRYVAANVLILWLALLVSVPLCRSRFKGWATLFVTGCCAVFFLVFTCRREFGELRSAITDLIRRREAVPNVEYMLAERFRQIGIRPGDRIAYIGTSDNADWIRLDGVKIVGEVPVNHSRNRHLFNNLMTDSVGDVVAFWKANKADQEKVLKAFENVGAKVAVTDGSNPYNLASGWQPVLSREQQLRFPRPDSPFDPGVRTEQNTRYLLLDPTKSKRERVPRLK